MVISMRILGLYHNRILKKSIQSNCYDNNSKIYDDYNIAMTEAKNHMVEPYSKAAYFHLAFTQNQHL